MSLDATEHVRAHSVQALRAEYHDRLRARIAELEECLMMALEHVDWSRVMPDDRARLEAARPR